MKHKQRIKRLEKKIKPAGQLPLVLWDRKPTDKEQQTREVIQVIWE